MNRLITELAVDPKRHPLWAETLKQEQGNRFHTVFLHILGIMVAKTLSDHGDSCKYNWDLRGFYTPGPDTSWAVALTGTPWNNLWVPFLEKQIIYPTGNEWYVSKNLYRWAVMEYGDLAHAVVFHGSSSLKLSLDTRIGGYRKDGVTLKSNESWKYRRMKPFEWCVTMDSRRRRRIPSLKWKMRELDKDVNQLEDTGWFSRCIFGRLREENQL